MLEKEPLDIISDAAVWSDPILVDSYLDQCYAEMIFAFETRYGGTSKLESGLYTWFEQSHAMTIADEARFGWVPAPKSHWIGNNGGVEDWWGYATVRRLNEFLVQMEVSGLDESYKSQRIAEARYLRAHAYFNMVKRYGGVPLITEVQQLNDSEESLFPARNREVEIYDFILSELDVVEEDLLSTEYGRVTKWTALALKSRAAMYAGSIATWGTERLDGLVGIPSSRANDFWQASYDASRKIITDGGFALYNVNPGDKTANFRNLFLDEGNSEVIFAERFDGLSGKGQSHDMWNVPRSYQVWGAGQQTSAYLEMVESFDNIDGSPGIIDRAKIASGYLWTVDELWGNKDPRFKATIYTHGTSWLNGADVLDYHKGIITPTGEITSGAYKGILAQSRMEQAVTPFGMLKYLDEQERAMVQERNHTDTDYIVFRYGEILLNYAEAAVELGNDGDALWAVNEIRTRAGMPNHGSITRDLVRKERKIELAFEGNRYWDLRRWRTATTDLTKSFNGLRIILDGDSFTEGSYDVLTARFKLEIIPNIDGLPAPFFDARHYYLPIGLGRTGQNSNLIENPGY
ncbi:MAG: RagB/SusD family nutrient uptake outer membrane protein [Flavobacteriaceae bacterium]